MMVTSNAYFHVSLMDLLRQTGFGDL